MNKFRIKSFFKFHNHLIISNLYAIYCVSQKDHFKDMSQFMVEFALPNPFPDKLIIKIPNQRMVVNQLLEDGKIQSYALSIERDRLWCVVNAEDELEVMRIIGEFPLIDYMQPSITELMFNNAIVMKVPAFSLN